MRSVSVKKMAASSPVSNGNDTSYVSFFKSFHLKPLTQHNIFYFYLPLNGAINYTALSVNIMNPSLFSRTFPKRDVTNIFLFNALIGSGLYILNRKHLTNTSTSTRIVYSGVGSILFTFGSVLLWAVVRSWLPKSVPLCATFGLGSGIFLLKVGRDYLDLVDSRCTEVA